MRCQICNMPNGNDVKICTNCGANIDEQKKNMILEQALIKKEDLSIPERLIKQKSSPWRIAKILFYVLIGTYLSFASVYTFSVNPSGFILLMMLAGALLLLLVGYDIFFKYRGYGPRSHKQFYIEQGVELLILSGALFFMIIIAIALILLPVPYILVTIAVLKFVKAFSNKPVSQ